MQLDPSIFKAYDIRGVVPSTVNESVAEALGRAFGATALGQGDHPERRPGAVTFADHVQVAHLEDAQRQHAPGEQHGIQGEQRQRGQGESFGRHRNSVLRRYHPMTQPFAPP